jgi:hypothetical protein
MFEKRPPGRVFFKKKSTPDFTALILDNFTTNYFL